MRQATKYTDASKLQAVMDTLGKTEQEQSAYCRIHRAGAGIIV